jgi:hypothetical protein
VKKATTKKLTLYRGQPLYFSSKGKFEEEKKSRPFYLYPPHMWSTSQLYMHTYKIHTHWTYIRTSFTYLPIRIVCVDNHNGAGSHMHAKLYIYICMYIYIPLMLVDAKLLNKIQQLQQCNEWQRDR